ncbi:long-chain fatty acid--CoA ligase [Azospirillum sp. B4]|uniref:long-chain-fatty-acid--CoA ligase n=1 Tax=Azospirillum sp. B4 TaxID=95605 RepID=UPI00034C9226|nr:long-chain fatty acid--CoA ligase [Azospirillum sp. B4]
MMADPAVSAAHIWEHSYPSGVDWNAPIPVKPLTDLFDSSATRFADRPFIDFLGKRYTYRQGADMVDRVAKGLQALGVGRGCNVGLFLPNTPYSVFCYYGILKTGATVVNFNPLYAERELVKQINDSEVEIMITVDVPQCYDKMALMLGQTCLKKIITGRMADILPFPKSVLYPLVKRKDIAHPPADGANLSFRRLIANDGRYRPVTIDPVEDVAVLQYTGGTTGVPKGAMLTHANLTANTVQSALWFYQGRPGQERMLGVLPLFHVFAMTGVMNLSIYLGAEMILLPRFEIEQVLDTIDKKKPTQFPAVPTIYTAINNYKDRAKYDLSSLAFSISGGAPLPLDVCQTFEGHTGCKLVEGYGLSESSPVATVNPIDGPVGGKVKVGSIGLPVPGTIIELIDVEDGKTPVALGQRGEVCIRGPQVMKGYWKRPDETAITLRDGRLHTGDVGYMDEDGYIYIVDRIKDMILAGGYNVYPRNVEEAIYLHPAVNECIVLGVPDPYRGQTVKAYIKLTEGHSLTQAELCDFLRDKLSAIELPKQVEFRDELPKTMIGKLSRKALLDELAAQQAAKAS